MLRKINKSGLVWLWLPIVLIALDRYSKFWVSEHLTFFEPCRILPIFNLTLAHNRGAAFSFLDSAGGWQNWLFGALAVIVSGIVIVWLSMLSSKDRWMNIALCLILTGALGNAWDRMLYGYVIDFLDFHLGSWHFAIFNIADSAICIGAFMIFLNWARKKNPTS